MVSTIFSSICLNYYLCNKAMCKHPTRRVRIIRATRAREKHWPDKNMIIQMVFLQWVDGEDQFMAAFTKL